MFDSLNQVTEWFSIIDTLITVPYKNICFAKLARVTFVSIMENPSRSVRK